jgi:hypothetical protein
MIRITPFARAAMTALAMFVVFNAMAVAQQPPQPSAEGQTQKPRPPGSQPAQREPTPPEPEEPERAGRPVNVTVEVTITDQVESEPAQKKTVSMIVADRTEGRVRAMGVAQTPTTPGAVSVRLNVDAFPEIQANDSIRLRLRLEYEPLPPGPSADAPRRPSTLTETLTVILQPGKPLTVSRAVDPFTNRRTSVDVTATIQK